MIVFTCLSLYCVISNHLVIWSIVVMAFINKSDFPPFPRMLQGPIKYTKKLFQGISSANLAGNLSYFLLTILYIDRCCNCCPTSGRLLYDGPVQILTNDLFRSIQSWMKDIWMIPFKYVFWSFYGIDILLLDVIILIVLWPPRKPPFYIFACKFLH